MEAFNTGEDEGLSSRDCAMRTLSLAVFLVVVLQAVASASSAHASPTEQAAAPMRAHAKPAHVLAEENRSAAVLKGQREPVSQARDARVLIRDVPRPKPVKIYWFFGGR